jgi:hypothetical protein
MKQYAEELGRHEGGENPESPPALFASPRRRKIRGTGSIKPDSGATG